MAVLFALGSASARADDGDGVYGRFDGDVMLSFAAGGFVTTGEELEGGGTLELRARYLDCAGPALWGSLRSDGEVRLGGAVELRPLFPALFLIDRWTGNEFFDLTLQSIGIELGAEIVSFDDPAVALAIGFAFEMPIVPPSVAGQGVFLRLSARHVLGRAGDTGGPDADVAEWSFGALFSIRASVETGLASGEVSRFRPDP
jgi:hypothetical protein